MILGSSCTLKTQQDIGAACSLEHVGQPLLFVKETTRVESRGSTRKFQDRIEAVHAAVNRAVAIPSLVRIQLLEPSRVSPMLQVDADPPLYVGFRGFEPLHRL